MSRPINVSIVGATGRIGSSVVTGLLASRHQQFNLTALIQPTSINKASTEKLKKDNVKIVPASLRASQNELVDALAGIDVVICILPPDQTSDLIPLADAALIAGVERFVPNMWSTPSLPKGVMRIRDWKEDVINHLKKIGLPYTVIDIGFWHEVMVPRVMSGRLDHVALYSKYFFVDDGSALCATSHIDDVGRYVARIVADPRTINRMVFAYGEVTSQAQVVQFIQHLSGETVPLIKVTSNQVKTATERGEIDLWPQVILEYVFSAWVRGDNQPKMAGLLGYLDAKDLYPDFNPITLEATIKEALAEGGVNPGFGNDEICASIEAALLRAA